MACWSPHGLGLSEILQPASDLLSMRATKAASSSGSAPLHRISCNGCPSRLCKEPLRCMTYVHGHTCAGEAASPSSSAAGPARKAPGNSASSTNACSMSSSKLHAMWRTNLHIIYVSTSQYCSLFPVLMYQECIAAFMAFLSLPAFASGCLSTQDVKALGLIEACSSTLSYIITYDPSNIPFMPEGCSFNPGPFLCGHIRHPCTGPGVPGCEQRNRQKDLQAANDS